MARVKFNRYLLINLLLVFSVFMASLIVRYHNIQAPIGRHHEFITSHVLISNYMMEKRGIAKVYFSSVFSFDSPADKVINSRAALHSKDSLAYYVSYPPGCFVYPYLAVKAVGAKVSIQHLRTYSLCNHFFTAFVFLVLMYEVFNKSLTRNIFWPALIGFAWFVLANGNLWFYSNVYFCDMQVNVFILLSLYFFVRIIKSTVVSYWHLAGLGLATFLGIYTEWLAIFLGFFMGIFFLVSALRRKRYVGVAAILLIALVASLGLTLYQYSLIAGWDNLMNVLTSKFLYRSGTNASHELDEYNWSNYFSRQYLSQSFEYNYKGLLDFCFGLAFLFAAVVLLTKIKGRKWANNGYSLGVLSLLFLACATHLLVFYNFNVVHDFSTVKWAMVLIGFVVVVLAELDHYLILSAYRPIMVWSIAAIIMMWSGWFLMHDINQYYANHRLEPVRFNEAMARTIDQYVSPNELIMANIATPESMFLSKRNIAQGNPEHVAVFLKHAEMDSLVYIAVKSYDDPAVDSVFRQYRDGSYRILFKK